jgi:hypothetical protein
MEFAQVQRHCSRGRKTSRDMSQRDIRGFVMITRRAFHIYSTEDPEHMQTVRGHSLHVLNREARVWYVHMSWGRSWDPRSSTPYPPTTLDEMKRRDRLPRWI